MKNQNHSGKDAPMLDVFGDDYAAVYDALYNDKNYDEECSIVHDILQRESHVAVRSILDLGCGTGEHAYRLSAMGYALTGIDCSPAMLRIASKKIKGISGATEPRFGLGDVRSFQLGRTFDAVLMMFAVLGYQTSNADIAQTFKAVRAHLAPGALFIFDVWNGLAVLATPPTCRIKHVEWNETDVVRLAEPELDVARHLCHVHYTLIVPYRDRPAVNIHEHHAMRFFFPLELQAFAENAGFEIVRISSFPDVEHPLDFKAWNALVVCRAH